MNLPYEIFKMSIWVRSHRSTLILILPILFAGIAFTIIRWNVAASQLFETRVIPVTGEDPNGGAFPLYATPVTQPTPSRMVQLAAANCIHPDGWSPYLVSATDSLPRLSVTYGIAIADFLHANCLGSTDLILPGQVIYVPDIIPGVLPLPSPTPDPTPKPVPVNPVIPTGRDNTNHQESIPNTPTDIPPSPAVVPQVPANAPVPPVNKAAHKKSHAHPSDPEKHDPSKSHIDLPEPEKQHPSAPHDSHSGSGDQEEQEEE